MKSKTTQDQIFELQQQLDDVNQSIENYFEGDNDQYFSDEYYRNLENFKAELEEKISKLL
jgi:hypothetical protein